MNPILESISSLLRDMAAQSAKAALLACAVALICLLPRRWLSAPWRHALWCAVFLRLMLPDLPIPGWSWNLNQLLHETPAGVTVAVEVPAFLPGENTPSLEDPVFVNPAPPIPATLERDAGPPGTGAATPQAPRAALSWWTILGIIWIAGAVVWWLSLAVAWWRFRRDALSPAVEAAPDAQAHFESCLAESGIRSRVRLQTSEGVSTPVVCGVFRPVILIPEAVVSSLPPHDLRLLLLHELGHVKRRDMMVQVVVSLLLGLHWWNPLLWLAWGRLRHEAEAATDAWVLRRTGPDTAPTYGAMLLQLASRACASGVALLLVPSLIGASSQGRRLRQRLNAILGHRPATRSAGVFGLAALALLGMSGFAQEPARKTTPEKEKPATAPVVEGTIGGILVDEQDRPIAGAHVEIEVKRTRSKFTKSVLPPGYQAPAPVKSNDEGRWQISGVPDGVAPSNVNPAVDTFFVYVSHPDFLHRSFAGSTELTEESYRKGTAKVVLKRGVSIKGVVRDEAGRPIAGATVQRGLSEPSRGVVAVMTDASGQYEIKAARTGDLAVRVRAGGFAAHLERVNVTKDSVRDFTLKRAHTLKLVIRDDKDQPVEGATVSVYPPADGWKNHESLWETKNVPADGRVVWDEAPGGKLMVDVVGRRFARYSTTVTAGEEAQIRVPSSHRLSTVTIKVKHAETGAPLSGCTIETGATYSPNSNTASWVNIESGMVAFTAGAAEGEYHGTMLESLQRRGAKFCVRRPGYLPEVTPRLDPAQGDATFTVALQEKEPVEITVLGPKDAPAANAKVIVAWQNSIHLKDFELNSPYMLSQMEFVGVTGPDGRCSLPPILSDAAVLVLHKDGFLLTNMADVGRVPSLRLGLYGQVEGLVTKNGKPAPGLKYEFHGGMASIAMGSTIIQSFDTVSDAEGRIFLPRVLPTQIGRFSESKPRTNPATGQIRTYTSGKTQPVPVGQVTTFNIEVEEPAVRDVTGRFVLQGGGVPERSRTTGSISLALQKTKPNVERPISMGIGMVDEKGRFTFQELQPGTYTLVITPGVHPKARYAFADGKTGIEVVVPPLSEDPARKKVLDLGEIEVVDTQK